VHRPTAIYVRSAINARATNARAAVKYRQSIRAETVIRFVESVAKIGDYVDTAIAAIAELKQPGRMDRVA
jgi:hypothetical protein